MQWPVNERNENPGGDSPDTIASVAGRSANSRPWTAGLKSTGPRRRSVKDRPAYAHAEMGEDAGGVCHERKAVQIERTQLTDEVDARQPGKARRE